MLFHVTATHTPENCVGYRKEKLPEVIEAIERSDDLARELDVKIHFLVSGAPEHVSYYLLEADSPGPIARFVNSVPFEQDFKVTPVVREQELAALGRQLAAT